MSTQKLPSGWTPDRVKKLADHYDAQVDAATAAEDESAARAGLTAESARRWLVDLAHQPIPNQAEVAESAIRLLSDRDILVLYRETKARLTQTGHLMK